MEDNKFINHQLCNKIKELIEIQDQLINTPNQLSSSNDFAIKTTTTQCQTLQYSLTKTIPIMNISSHQYILDDSSQLTTILLQSDHTNIYMFQVLSETDNLKYTQLPNHHLILSEPMKITAFDIIELESYGMLLGGDNGIVLKYHQGKVDQQQIIGNTVACFEKLKTQKNLVLVGFVDHQIVLWDFKLLKSYWIFKEGFTIPVPLHQIRVQYKDEYFLAAAQDGSITIWNIEQKIFNQIENQKNHKLPKFEVVPQHKILNVLRHPLLFIEFWGDFICSLEETNIFRMWMIEYQHKQYLTLQKFNIEDQVKYMKVFEQEDELVMVSDSKIYIYKLNEEFKCQILQVVSRGTQNDICQYGLNLLVDIKYTRTQMQASLQILRKTENEIDY